MTEYANSMKIMVFVQISKIREKRSGNWTEAEMPVLSVKIVDGVKYCRHAIHKTHAFVCASEHASVRINVDEQTNRSLGQWKYVDLCYLRIKPFDTKIIRVSVCTVHAHLQRIFPYYLTLSEINCCGWMSILDASAYIWFCSVWSLLARSQWFFFSFVIRVLLLPFKIRLKSSI